ncbi:hypothetical protein AAC387_Pa05g1929 [Persea americana]
MGFAASGWVGFVACGDGCAGQMVMQGGCRGEVLRAGVVQAKNEKEEEAGDAGRTVVQAKKEKEEEAGDAGRMQGRGAACRRRRRRKKKLVMQGGCRGESVPGGWLMEIRGADSER